ncbi:MAG: hypothetical protein JJU20_09560 [Opitutales bacterium]|nr:hypothetical protein [Opitutales bacterium]
MIECIVAIALFALGLSILGSMVSWSLNASTSAGHTDRLAADLLPEAKALAKSGIKNRAGEAEWIEIAWTAPAGVWFYRVHAGDGRSSRWLGPYHLAGDE